MKELLARIRAVFAGMNTRERMLVGGAGLLLAAFLLLVLVVNPLMGASDRAERRVESAAEELEAVRRLHRQYQAVHGRVALVEEQIAGGPQGELFTVLEQLAKQSSVKVDSMEPRTSSPSEEYRETKVQVGLKKVTLPQLVNYLHRIESGEQLLSIKGLRMRIRADAPAFLDVSFTVSSFERI